MIDVNLLSPSIKRSRYRQIIFIMIFTVLLGVFSLCLYCIFPSQQTVHMTSFPMMPSENFVAVEQSTQSLLNYHFGLMHLVTDFAKISAENICLQRMTHYESSFYISGLAQSLYHLTHYLKSLITAQIFAEIHLESMALQKNHTVSFRLRASEKFLFPLNMLSSEDGNMPQRESQLLSHLPANNNVDKRTEAAFLAYVNHLSMQQQISLLSMKRNASQKFIPDAQLLMLKLQGTPEKLLSFLLALTPAKFVFAVTDFAMNANTHQQSVLTLSVLMMLAAHTEKTPLDTHPDLRMRSTLFCHSQFSSHLDANILQTVPLSQIKMVGYLGQENHHRALLLLYNRFVLPVSEQMSVGKEAFQIKSINKEYIQLTTPLGRTKILWLAHS